MKESPRQGRRIVLFDETCLLCDGAVRFILSNDPTGVFSFAPLQSAAAHQLLGKAQDHESFRETMILIENEACFTRSEAVLRIARHLRMPWPLLTVFLHVPRALCDAAYRWVARNRHRWFGRQERCLLPTEEQRSRFL